MPFRDTAWPGPKTFISEQNAYSLETAKNWLDRGGDINVTSFSKQGHTLLMMACLRDQADLVAELLSRPGVNINLKVNGKTALHHAATMGNDQCAQLLLDAGADRHIRVDIDDSEFTENDGLTALEIVDNLIAREGMKPRQQRLQRMLSGGYLGMSR